MTIGFFERNVAEIGADKALLRYGIALGMVEVLTAVWAWKFVPGLTPTTPPICWPILQDCIGYRVLDAPGLYTWISIIGGLGCLAAISFATRRPRAGWVLLSASTLLKVAFVLLDFRLRRNQHYMGLAATGVFLLWPHKRDGLRLLIVAFYFWAGSLKLNSEWLTGSTLYRPVWLFEGWGLIAACSYVVVLELGLVWGALTRHPLWFWGTLAQLATFHLFSWPVVGFFYPVLMALLLSIFPLVAQDRRGSDSLLQRLVHLRAPKSVYALFIIFGCLQLGPRLLPGDSALTGEGRFLMLHMFDSRPVCERQLSLRSPDGDVALIENQELSTRIRCDPWVLYAAGQNVCRGLGDNPDNLEVDMLMKSRRGNQDELHTYVDERSICKRDLRYHWWRHNEWIHVR